MKIRVATESDIPELAKLYRDSVTAIAKEYYSPEQVATWAASSRNTEGFKKFILEATTFLAEKSDKILGFSGVENDGHVASIYVRPGYFRQGIGTRLLEVVVEHAQIHNIPQLYSEASEFSKPLFEKFGFQNYDIERVNRNGVWFERYLMRRSL